MEGWGETTGFPDDIIQLVDVLLGTPLACLLAALAWLVSGGGGGGWKDDGEEIRNEVQLAQHLCEEIFGRKQIPGLGEESEGKGQVESESTLRTRHL